MIEIDPRWTIALVAHFYRVELKMEISAIFKQQYFTSFLYFFTNFQCTVYYYSLYHNAPLLFLVSWQSNHLDTFLEICPGVPPKIGSITTAATAHFSFFCNHRQLQYTFLLIYGTQSLILIDCSFTWVYLYRYIYLKCSKIFPKK